MELASIFVEKLLDYTLKAIGQQLGYLIFYHKNIEVLKNQVEVLKEQQVALQHSIEEARRNSEIIEDIVQRWMSKVDGMRRQAEQLYEEESQARTDCSRTLCPNLWSRYQLSKRAKKMRLEVVAEIQEKRNFTKVSYRDSPKWMLNSTNDKSNEGIDSRVPIINQIMEALRDPNVNMIGLCGLGGVGKTTIAKEVAKKAKDERMFEKVIMAIVSHDLNLESIQGQIAEMLGMELKEKTESIRTYRLNERLKKEKNLLIILDDLWEELDLCKVGIPFVDDGNHKKLDGHYKVLLTSRNEKLLSDQMNCERNIKVDVLSEKEAWELFERIVEFSTDSNSPGLICVANEIVHKCQGLPLAIVAIAGALRNKGPNEWKDALRRLKNPLRRNITGIKEVDSILKLSYDQLSSEQQSIFLLSAMLSHDPLIKDLFLYYVGLDLLERVDSMEEAQEGFFTLVSKLKASNLLLDGFSSQHFTLHDVVREYALSIASNECHFFVVRHKKLNEWPHENLVPNYIGMCFEKSDINDLPEELHAPTLEFFLLNSVNRDLKIPSLFFKSTKELKVLGFTNMSFPLLPSLGCLENLKTLCLHSCLLKDVAEIGKLKKLKILSLAYSQFEQLPFELAQLTCLQMLNLAHCSKLKVIPPKLLSSLERLEVLDMEKSFNHWEAEGSCEGNENASLGELKTLPISSLDIHIPDASVLPEDLFLDNNALERYRIFIGKNWTWFGNYETSTTLKLQLQSGIHLALGIQKLLEKVEDLWVHESNGLKNVLFNLDGRGFPYLKHLGIGNNDDIEFVFNSLHLEDAFPMLMTLILENLNGLKKLCQGPEEIFNSLFNSKVSFPKLEKMELSNLNKLIPSIWDDQLPDSSFSNLKTLTVCECGFVKLVPLHVLKLLNNLEELEVGECDMLEMVFDLEELNSSNETLSSLPVPLKRLKLQELPELKHVWSNGSQGIVSFQSLRHVLVSDCEGLTSIFPASIAKGGMLNLEELEICGCRNLEVIIAKDEVLESVAPTFVFPSLMSLHLEGLPNLKSFYPHSHMSRWPMLQQLQIENEASSSLAIQQSKRTLDLKYPLFSHEQVSFPKLEKLELCKLNKLIPSIWDDQFPHNSFSNLKKLTVQECGFVKLVLFHVLKSLDNLEELEVKECDMLEMVFDLEELNSSNETLSSLPVPLKRLKLQELPELKHVWSNGSQGIVSFQSLRHVLVSDCEGLTSIFPASIAKGGMLNLEELEICGCRNLEVIIAKDEVSVAPTFVFPSLMSLHLGGLPNLKNFYPQSHKSKWPRLQSLRISNCEGLDIFEQVIPNLEQFLNFKSLELNGHSQDMEPLGEAVVPPFRELCLGLLKKAKHIWNEHLPLHILQHLETLYVFCCHDLISLGPSSISLTNLTNLNVHYCWELTSLLTSSTATSLANLSRLTINDCKQIKEIITKPQEEDDDEKEIIFYKLGSLILGGLPKLKSFCSHNYIFKFPLLDEVIIKECPRLRMFCPGDIDTPLLKCVVVARNQNFWDTNLNITIQQRFTTKEVISTFRTMVLDMKDITMIKNDQFPLDIFPEVKALHVESFIDDCVTFPHSILERFPNLCELHVENSSFEEIFTSQTDMGKHAAFAELHLAHLDQLKNIWNDDSQIQSQNLEVLEVESCCSLIKLAPSSASFENLRVLKVSNCHHLLYLVTNSTAKSLVNLYQLETKDCKMMEEIVRNETNEDVDGGITFSRLIWLTLSNLPSLKRFSPGVVARPSFLQIEGHHIDSKDMGDLNKTIALLLSSKDGRDI